MVEWNPSDHAKDMWIWNGYTSTSRAKLLHLGTTPGDSTFPPVEYYVDVTYLHGRDHRHLILGHDCFHTKREMLEHIERVMRLQGEDNLRTAKNAAEALARGVDE